MAKKCDLKKWLVIGLLIVVIFFLFHSFSTMSKFEGYTSQNEGPYENCSDITNCSSCQDYTTKIDGKCGWCVNKKKCVAREPPQRGDPNFESKYTDFIYFNSHQDECTSDFKDCTNVPGPALGPVDPDKDMHPIFKWFLIKKTVTPPPPAPTPTPTPDPSPVPSNTTTDETESPVTTPPTTIQTA